MRRNQAAQRDPIAERIADRTVIPLGAYTIPEFCRAHALSETQYFKLKRQGEGPDEMLLGSRRKGISVEAAARWRRKREEALTLHAAAE